MSFEETKYSYILPIRNRHDLLKCGLDSLANMNYDKDKFEVVIADYMSEDPIIDIVQSYRGILNMTYLCIDHRRYKYHHVYFHHNKCNPALAQNVAVKNAKGKFIILTSPEILHWSENLNNLDKIENLENKFIYGKVIEKHKEDFYHNGNGLYKNIDKMESSDILCDWNVLKSVTLYFIGVMSKKIYMQYGGIDEAYMSGIAYEDEDFGKRMEKVKELSLVYEKSVCGIHLKHDRSYQEPSAISSNHAILLSKEKTGIENNLYCNKDIKPGTHEVLIQRSQFWRF